MKYFVVRTGQLAHDKGQAWLGKQFLGVLKGRGQQGASEGEGVRKVNQLWVLALHMCQVGSVGVAGKTALPAVLDKSESQSLGKLSSICDNES